MLDKLDPDDLAQLDLVGRLDEVAVAIEADLERNSG